MVRARLREQWEHTSLLAAPLFNAIRDPHRRPTPYAPADFNPYAEKSDGREPVMRVDFKMLRSTFVR